ncbi:hypothetical protein EC178200_1490 [Escherichia coli 178200]|nr:hypothetical protein EC178200_1490 [Escherichia coli 178200]
MARLNIDTGGYPVQPRAKVAGCGFNLPDIGNPRFREPELKLYRRIINRKMRRGGYLKIARRQLNPRRRYRCGNPERYRCRIALLSPRIYRPDCQRVPSQRQLLKRYVVSAVRAVLTSRSLPSSAATVRRSRKLTPFTTFGCPTRQHLIFPAVCVTSRSVLHAGGVTPLPCRSGRRQSAPRYPRWPLFPVHAARR